MIPETQPLPVTQQHEEIFSSPSLATNNRYQLLQNTLYIIQTIDFRVEQLATKNKSKGKNKNK